MNLNFEFIKFLQILASVCFSSGDTNGLFIYFNVVFIPVLNNFLIAFRYR